MRHCHHLTLVYFDKTLRYMIKITGMLFIHLYIIQYMLLTLYLKNVHGVNVCPWIVYMWLYFVNVFFFSFVHWGDGSIVIQRTIALGSKPSFRHVQFAP